MAWASDDITAYLIAKENGIVNIDEPTFMYRVNRYTITKTGDPSHKLNAIQLESEFYNSFLNSLSPQTIIEELSLINLKSKYKKCIDKKIAQTIASACDKHIWKLIKWLFKIHNYKNYKTIFIWTILFFIKNKSSK